MQQWQSRVVVTEADDLESLNYLLFSILQKKKKKERKSPVPRLGVYLMLPLTRGVCGCLYFISLQILPREVGWVTTLISMKKWKLRATAQVT